MKKLGEFNENDDDTTVRAKKLLQKCAYSMISHQELSAQQVASYLMDYEDHFTSHQFRNLYWTSFEAFINQQDPSRECYLSYQENESLNNNTEDTIIDDDTDTIRLDTNNNVFEDDAEIGISSEDSEDVHESEEIIVTVDIATEELVAKASQVADYQLRPQELLHLSVWEFVKSVDKVRIRKKDKNSKNQLDEINLIPDEPDISTNMNFQNGHCEQSTHQLKVRSSDKFFVAVPIGPSLPRRNVDKIRPKYCRLMLILFKPWY